MPHLRGSLVSKPTPHTLAITGSDFLWPISLTPIMAAADRVSRGGGRSRICTLEWSCGHTKSIPSTAARGTLAWLSLKAAILASQNQPRPAKAAPSLSRFEHVVSGTVAAGSRRIASKWQKGPSNGHCRVFLLRVPSLAIPPQRQFMPSFVENASVKRSWTERTVPLENSASFRDCTALP
ncbi:hypothetical protein M419DRAFT_9427 [Trichoderma reesei RUT C-30]|uniref:Uncharacterized protein n=1 Tax=Hypocrea jecorina (strain ATCC 56765 / BCRC 32924 / NRRL 11460 / Rut C-30) TaxID=1344414 RepID=A0A024S889_HYPJR|nr:hypothetical protein M419DRAFT_9427 [Trichoderma reesei RUT C-30]